MNRAIPMTFVTQDFVKIVSPDLPQARARVAVIFGNVNHTLVARMAHRAADLYRDGHVQKIIVTGGKNFADKNHTESQYARKILLSRGVHGGHILWDNHSMNTLENVVNARRLLRKDDGRLRREIILCLGIDIAARRFLMTMAKNWPEATPTFIGFETTFTRPKNRWQECNEIGALLKQDFAKWGEYKARGHIAPVNTRHLAWKIHASNKPRKASL